MQALSEWKARWLNRPREWARLAQAGKAGGACARAALGKIAQGAAPEGWKRVLAALAAAGPGFEAQDRERAGRELWDFAQAAGPYAPKPGHAQGILWSLPRQDGAEQALEDAGTFGLLRSCAQWAGPAPGGALAGAAAGHLRCALQAAYLGAWLENSSGDARGMEQARAFFGGSVWLEVAMCLRWMPDGVLEALAPARDPDDFPAGLEAWLGSKWIAEGRFGAESERLCALLGFEPRLCLRMGLHAPALAYAGCAGPGEWALVPLAKGLARAGQSRALADFALSCFTMADRPKGRAQGAQEAVLAALSEVSGIDGGMAAAMWEQSMAAHGLSEVCAAAQKKWLQSCLGGACGKAGLPEAASDGARGRSL